MDGATDGGKAARESLVRDDTDRVPTCTLYLEVLDNHDLFAYRSLHPAPPTTMTLRPNPSPVSLDALPSEGATPVHHRGASSPIDRSTPPVTGEERQQLAARVLVDALLLGIVGDALLRVSSWGANLTLWSLGIVAAMLTLARRRYDTPFPALWIAAPAAVLSLAFAWRDSASLAVANALALAATLALLASAIARGPGFSVIASRVRDLVESAIHIGLGALFGMLPLVLSDVSFRDVTGSRTSARLIAATRAALIAIPLLLVFGGLFASADPVFERIVADALRIDPEAVVSHLVMTGAIAWVIGGFLRFTVLGGVRSLPFARVPDGVLGLTEVSVALGSLVLLFAAFVAVQLRYFFGGDTLVQATVGMSYADYARRGFFELVTVSALVLPVLLAAHTLLRRDNPRAEGVYRALSLTLIGLLGVIMYSALGRMRLYQAVYGYTTDRLFATIFMAWLVVVFAWFTMTVIRGRDARFLIGVLASAWAFLAGLNVANPDAFVARANIERAELGKELDVNYLSRLGADAAPALTQYLVSKPLTPSFPWPRPEVASNDTSAAARAQQSRSVAPYVTSRDDYTARCYAARELLSRWGPSTARDWRSWTLGRARARRAVAAKSALLRQLAHPPLSGQSYRPCPTPP